MKHFETNSSRTLHIVIFHDTCLTFYSYSIIVLRKQSLKSRWLYNLWSISNLGLTILIPHIKPGYFSTVWITSIWTQVSLKKTRNFGLASYPPQKVSANKIKILVFLVILVWTPQHFTYFGWTFAGILILFVDALQENLNHAQFGQDLW